MIIRDRVPEDAAALEAIARVTHRVDRYPKYLPDDVRSFIVSADAVRAWVAVRDGRVIGQIALHEKSVPEVMDLVRAATGLPEDRVIVIARLLVDPGARRAGVGRALLDRAVEEATRMGRRAVLDVVEEHTAAIALYDGAGWTQLGTVEWSLPGDLWFREFVYLAPGPRTGRGGHCDVRGWTRRFGA
ncbi:MAG TPA: GNAT family N-acetyltransferase [Acidimicrobiales bacterium]|nr:GNAT family N-acetyltransferase [Acidimicrobiales bacterium]